MRVAHRGSCASPDVIFGSHSEIAAAIGVVAAGRDLALVVEQPIEHMRDFAGGRPLRR
jgi:hypothetical protein